jgi:hypothetical protein
MSTSSMAIAFTATSPVTATSVLCARDNRTFDALSYLILFTERALASGLENFKKFS